MFSCYKFPKYKFVQNSRFHCNSISPGKHLLYSENTRSSMNIYPKIINIEDPLTNKLISTRCSSKTNLKTCNNSTRDLQSYSYTPNRIKTKSEFKS